MPFEWDQAKSRSNLDKHGISFEEAIKIFDSPVLTKADTRDYIENRDISFGQIGLIVILAVIHTDRKGVTRIISARKANRRERERYHDHLAQALGRD